mgnify:CR=1 FL=1
MNIGVKQMGIIFQVAAMSKSDVVKVLVEILKQAEKEGVEIYERQDDCSIDKD